jgi:hypothetical protein
MLGVERMTGRSMSLIAELRRRHVFRAAAGYGGGAWLAIEVANTVFPQFGLPPWTVRSVIVLAPAVASARQGQQGSADPARPDAGLTGRRRHFRFAIGTNFSSSGPV